MNKKNSTALIVVILLLFAVLVSCSQESLHQEEAAAPAADDGAVAAAGEDTPAPAGEQDDGGNDEDSDGGGDEGTVDFVQALYEVYAQKILNPPLASADEGYALLGVKDVQIIAPLTGEFSINRTSTNYDVYGTDLGIPFEVDDTIFIAFGDTFSGPSFQGNWRSNALAYTTDRDASDGVLFDGMISLKTNDNAIEILSSRKRDGDEMTVIPTGAVAAGDDIYMCYMSVRKWGVPGQWECNYGGMAKSSDSGQTWQKSTSLKWDGAGTFVQLCPVKSEGYIYFYGIGGGRVTGVTLMRVAEAEIEDRDAYEYMTGFDGNGEPVYQKGEDAGQNAYLVIDKPAGELSVMFNPYLDEWIITYLRNEDLIIRSSKTLEGPFSEPRLIARQSEYPSLYGAFMTPSYCEDDGRIMYFMMSIFDPVYNVVILRAEIVKG